MAAGLDGGPRHPLAAAPAVAGRAPAGPRWPRAAAAAHARRDARKPDRTRDRRGEHAALRGAGRLLPDRARSPDEVQRLRLARPGDDAARGGGGGTRADLCARRNRRRDAGARPRLRMGRAGALDRAALPVGARGRGVQCGVAAPAHRSGARDRGPRQPGGGHRRHEPVPAPRPVRSDRVGRDVRAHAQLRTAASPHPLLAGAGRESLRALVRASAVLLLLRARWRSRLDGPAFLHGRHDALDRPASAVPD